MGLSEGEGMKVTGSKSSGRYISFDGAFLLRSSGDFNEDVARKGGCSGTIYTWMSTDEFMNINEYFDGNTIVSKWMERKPNLCNSIRDWLYERSREEWNLV